MATPGIRPLVAGNWKMNGSLAMTDTLIRALRAKQSDIQLPVDILVCPPFPYLSTAASLMSGSNLQLGAQDCHASPNGAHTGDVAAGMLREIGCHSVILGHSERRTDHDESSAEIASKAKAAAAAGLTPIICVGETKHQRDTGEALKIVEKQIIESFSIDFNAEKTVIAYEPVWAIGTGLVPMKQDIEAMHRHIRELLKHRFTDGAGIKILYGGSVKPSNALEIMSIAEVNGALVGGASLKVEDFWAIIEGCAKSTI